MKKKTLVVFGILLLVAIILFFLIKTNIFNKQAKNPKNSAESIADNQLSYLLPGFPIDQVPLHQLEEISSNKIFVNTDPKNTSTFDKTNYAYFNVVFFTKASQQELLDFYKNFFDEQIVEEYNSPDMVKGRIGEYKVSVAHYGVENTAYMQVHLPNYQDQAVENYFADYPAIFKNNELSVEHEKSYGLLNQKGGEIEYTKYFTVLDSGDLDNDGEDDRDEFKLLEEEYREKYKNESNYQFDEATNTLTWNQDDYAVYLVLQADHGRIYLMLRKSMGE